MLPVKVRFDDDSSVWVESNISPGAEVLTQLKSWGVRRRKSRTQFSLTASNWLHIIPLQQCGVQPITEQTPVLFELRDESQLPVIVNEILRQGNDRQSFRVVGTGEHQRTLLRVLGPPYYSLLRALDVQTGPSDSVRAYVEQASRVWVRVGYHHALGNRITPAAGQHLMLDPGRSGLDDWRALKEEPFGDVYDVLEFRLPTAAEEIQSVADQPMLEVPVRLVRGGADDPGELFVIRHNAIHQLDGFVRSTSDEVLTRLSFAVTDAQPDREPYVIVRIRPGRSKPPVLVFDGLSCRRYLKIPNLFIPTGLRLHPPLRRDAVREMLADDESRIVWLEPAENERHDDFAVVSILDSAFRPLSQWIDYTVDRDSIHITAWKASHQFDFEDFVCREEKPKQQKKEREKKPPRTPRRSPPKDPGQAPNEGEEPGSVRKVIRRLRRPTSTPDDQQESAEQLRSRLREVEAQFIAADTTLDDPSREPVWTEMADLNRQLTHFADAGICWQHQLWEQDPADPETAFAWLETEVAAARHLNPNASLGGTGTRFGEAQLTALVNTKATVSPNMFGQVAAFVASANVDAGSAQIVQKHQSSIRSFLERHEPMLPTRSCWLAWHALAQASGDVLMLARARDRILQRLFDQGLVPDRDLPGFLRMSSSQGAERFRAVREKVADLHRRVRTWSKANLAVASQHTLDYVDLIFSYAFGRLGEAALADQTLTRALGRLNDRRDAVHAWLGDAFEFRVHQASSGLSASTSLPAELLELLESIPRLERYKVDRLRQHSSILDPHEQLDPYRNWRRRHSNDLQHELSSLYDILDRDELADRLQSLFGKAGEPEDRARVVTSALELSPRLGERFAAEMLAEVGPADEPLRDTLLRAGLLEKGLHIAAHYDQREYAHLCLERMNELIASQVSADVATLEALESLLSRSFASLRKLGMRDEIAFLLDHLTNQVRPADPDRIEPERMRVLLALAGGWFYFGQDRGWKDIDRARDILLGSELTNEGHVGAKKQTDLAVAYIRSVGQAPLNQAIERLNELFEQLRGIHDSATVNTHYSLKQLNIVDALVQTIVSDSFTMNKESQRWLDDEEYLVRRRIHRDMRQMMS